MVEIRDLRKRFGALTALDGISLAIKPGEITSIVGPNAAGKSTLLKCVVGLIRPDAGEILIDGAVINGDWDYRNKIGYVPQTPRFPEALCARELLAFLSNLRGVAAHHENSLIERFGLESAMSRPLRYLSGGTRQKISLVIAAVFDPKILVMDEPTVGLDPLSSRRQRQWLREERARGKTIIVASHLMAELEDLVDRVIFLLDGRVYFDGAPARALATTGERTLEATIAKMMEDGLPCAEC
ncbi:MAG TPA: ABC transporter ATP-binding protein [Candidatus Acidoferrales bacterium]|nr:ABC transporter ATP-binding protein [Candidatus Acidoferrales bacterium]